MSDTVKKETAGTSAPVKPSRTQLEQELQRERNNKTFLGTLRSTIFTLLVVAAVAILIAVLLLPVLKIYGKSMTPTLEEGNIVLSVKGSEFKTGDVIAFYYNNKLLVKRVIAQPGEWVDIDKEGNVYLNNQMINEPYISDRAFGQCDLDLPYQVPESRIFVMGDHRSVSVDSRSTAIGCVAEEQIVGKIVFCIWPLKNFGPVK